MFLLDKPLVSDLLRKSVRESGLPVIDIGHLGEIGIDGSFPIITPTEAIERFRQNPHQPLYCNSENSIGWIAEHLAFTDFPRQIHLMKDKVAFRELMRPVNPDLLFQSIPAESLGEFNPAAFGTPFIIKPAVGFFSMGVHRVNSVEQWPSTLAAMRTEIASLEGAYPREVMDATTFIAEQIIEGEEFAVDASYDAEGNPSILNIMHHRFSNVDDTGDRVYLTSKAVMEQWHDPLLGFLRDLGQRAGLKNFPLHGEVRIDASGNIIPIEINPMRFGGWCASDIAIHAHGVDHYRAHLTGTPPDWKAINAARGDEITALIVLDTAHDLDLSKIASFDYEKLLATFEKPLELRRTDYRRFRVFGFLYVQTQPDRMEEIERILHSDLSEFITWA